MDLRMSGVYDEMRFSDAWRALNARQRDLYLCMKSARYSMTRTEQKRIKDLDNQDQSLFFFNRERWTKGSKPTDRKNYSYELYGHGGTFYKDRDALIKYGFIEKVEPGPSVGIREKMLYRMSSRWKNYKETEQTGNGISL